MNKHVAYRYNGALFSYRENGVLTPAAVWISPETIMIGYRSQSHMKKKKTIWEFPGGSVVKNPPASSGDIDSIPGLGKSHML